MARREDQPAESWPPDGRDARDVPGTRVETLALGLLGKLALWRALLEVAPSDARLSGVDFQALAERAEAQHAHVEGQRLALARPALRNGSV